MLNLPWPKITLQLYLGHRLPPILFLRTIFPERFQLTLCFKHEANRELSGMKTFETLSNTTYLGRRFAKHFNKKIALLNLKEMCKTWLSHFIV